MSPREVKRMLSAYAVLEAAVRGEISLFDVLAFSWSLTQSPGLRDAIAANLDKPVDDPSQSELIDMVASSLDRRSAATPVDILKDAAEGYEPILKAVFPRFSEREAEDHRATRICRRRNLVRLLYLGNPTWMVPRAEIELVWSLGDGGELERKLRAIKKDDKLPALLDRLDDLLPDLAPSGDAAFFSAVSRVTITSSDWIREPHIDRDIAEDGATSVPRLGLLRADQAPRVKSLVHALIAGGDLALTRWARSRKPEFRIERTVARVSAEI